MGKKLNIIWNMISHYKYVIVIVLGIVVVGSSHTISCASTSSLAQARWLCAPYSLISLEQGHSVCTGTTAVIRQLGSLSDC